MQHDAVKTVFDAVKTDSKRAIQKATKATNSLKYLITE